MFKLLLPAILIVVPFSAFADCDSDLRGRYAGSKYLPSVLALTCNDEVRRAEASFASFATQSSEELSRAAKLLELSNRVSLALTKDQQTVEELGLRMRACGTETAMLDCLKALQELREATPMMREITAELRKEVVARSSSEYGVLLKELDSHAVHLEALEKKLAATPFSSGVSQ